MCEEALSSWIGWIFIEYHSLVVCVEQYYYLCDVHTVLRISSSRISCSSTTRTLSTELYVL